MKKAILTGMICFLIGSTATVFAVKTNLIEIPDNFNGVSTLNMLNWESLQYKQYLSDLSKSPNPEAVKDYNDCLAKTIRGNTKIGSAEILKMRSECKKTYQEAIKNK